MHSPSGKSDTVKEYRHQQDAASYTLSYDPALKVIAL